VMLYKERNHMTAITVPTAGRCRRDRNINLWLMTDERPRRRGRGRHGRGLRGPAGFGGPGFGPGRRAGRGDMRAAILALLAEEPMHGYQIIQVISERSGGNWTPSPGSVYPTLQHLEDEGLIEPAPSESGRNVYTLTEAGRTAQAADGTATPWAEAEKDVDDDLVELRDLVHQVLAATRQVAQAGTTAQVKGAQDVLRTARKGIYRLLAEDTE
jgi:DNA-binding PadR family transcriptional regulator